MSSVNTQEHALDVAAGQLHGTITRTTSSVIGARASETLIFATSNQRWSVTAMLAGIKIAFLVAPRGLFRKRLRVDGSPPAAVEQILDPDHRRRLEVLQPLVVELMPNGLRLEHKLGAPDEIIGRAMDVVVMLAARTRAVQQGMLDTGRTRRHG